MRVFVDANTILSGLLFTGNESTLLELGRLGALYLVINEYVLGEVRRALKRKEFQLKEEEQDRLVRYALECVSITENPSKEKIKEHYDLLDDKKDLPILAGAMGEDCKYLVTGDGELLSDKVKQLINSITTSKLLEKLTKEKSLQL